MGRLRTARGLHVRMYRGMLVKVSKQAQPLHAYVSASAQGGLISTRRTLVHAAHMHMHASVSHLHQLWAAVPQTAGKCQRVRIQ